MLKWMLAVDVSSVICILVILFFIVALVGIFVIYITTSPEPENFLDENEKYFKNPSNGDSVQFPSLQEPASCDLSVVVPAYDEEKRLPSMLDECLEFLEKRQISDSSFVYELIIVDDGSKDKTIDVGLHYSLKYGVDKVRVLTLAKNRGKGGAVRMGMLCTRGQHLLFADADGATKFSDLVKLEVALKDIVKTPESAPAIIVGSRAHLEKESIAKRSLFRTILMHGFHFLVWMLCVRTIRDTQCGFKLFSREAARLCFYNLHIQRWAFDVELLYIAESLNIPLKEIAVNWTEIEGSKLTPFWSSLQMGRDLFLLWLRYRICIWKVNRKNKIQ